MPDLDLAITGGTLVSARGMAAMDLGIHQGRIALIAAPGFLPPARETIDARGLHVLPGAIDVHTHIREPGLSHKETWASATRAAAAGGVTTVFDMPNTIPPTAEAASLAQKHAIAAAQAHVDFGLYGAVLERNLDDLLPMAAAGAAAFKLQMGSDNPAMPPPPDGAILEAFRRIATTGLRCTVHAENQAILHWEERRLRAAGRTDAAAHLEMHPDVAAAEAVSRVGIFSEFTGCPIHIAHESSRHSLPHIRFARQRGVDMTAETCPHYLFLSIEDGPRLGANFLRVKPPLRDASHRAPLWDALLDGTIDILSTDHAPHLPEEKRRSSVWDCAPGFPGVETSMPLMLSQVAHGRLTLPDYVRMACEAPARAFGLAARKGRLSPGLDADIVLVDMTRSGVLRGAALHSIGNGTPFEGMPVQGLPVRTLLRGQTIALDGAVTCHGGIGRNVRN